MPYSWIFLAQSSHLTSNLRRRQSLKDCILALDNLTTFILTIDIQFRNETSITWIKRSLSVIFFDRVRDIRISYSSNLVDHASIHTTLLVIGSVFHLSLEFVECSIQSNRNTSSF